MSEFSHIEVGDLVYMPGVPFVVEVLEITELHDKDYPSPIFMFRDPATGVHDWMPVDWFREVGE